MVYDVTIRIWQYKIIFPGPSFAFFSLLRLRLRETKWTFQALGVHINHVPTMTSSWLFMDPIYASAVLRPHRKPCNVYCVTCAKPATSHYWYTIPRNCPQCLLPFQRNTPCLKQQRPTYPCPAGCEAKDRHEKQNIEDCRNGQTSYDSHHCLVIIHWHYPNNNRQGIIWLAADWVH